MHASELPIFGELVCEWPNPQRAYGVAPPRPDVERKRASRPRLPHDPDLCVKCRRRPRKQTERKGGVIHVGKRCESCAAQASRDAQRWKARRDRSIPPAGRDEA